MSKRKVLVVFGTRPEAIKLAPVVRELRSHPHMIPVICVTGQHRSLLDQALAAFEMVPDFDLGVMKPGQTLTEIAAEICLAMQHVLEQVSPDYVLVHGDTTTCFAASVATFYRGIPVGHVEAGLRTWNPRAPFPEEAHRAMVGRLASLHFAPTSHARRNLLREGIDPGTVHVTGNTVIDALRLARDALQSAPAGEIERAIGATLHAELSQGGRPVILVTAHRRENLGARLEVATRAIRALAKRHADWRFIYLLHANPAARQPPMAALGALANVALVEPLAYLPFVWVMMRSTLILSDSGGLQEEASELGKPILIMRDVTERPEAVEQGTARLVGTAESRIVAAVEDAVLRPPGPAVQRRRRLYGDGRAAGRIAEALWSALSQSDRETEHPRREVPRARPHARGGAQSVSPHADRSIDRPRANTG